nr:amidohydrolase family protein [uncultured Eisenbergiella sp.]
MLVADRLIIGDGKTVIEQGAVVLRGKRILAAGRAEELRRLFPEEEIRLPGCTLMPGMIDMHTHIGYYYGEKNAERLAEDRMLRAYFIGKRMEDTLKAGVTTIRDMSSADGIGTVLKEAAAAGYLRVPRIVTSLRGLCITGGHGCSMTGAVEEVDGVEAVRRAVRRNIRDGADCIKLLDSEAYRGEEFNQEELDAAVSEAHRFGRKVAAHAGYGPSMEMCIQAGCDSIEHGTHLSVEQAERMRDNGQTWVPTIYVFHYAYELVKNNLADGDLSSNGAYLKDTVETYRDMFKKLYDTGVLVATGTDTDACSHPQASPVARECALMVQYGISPMEAIACATGNGAKALGLSDSLGLLREGCLADLLAVRGNPGENIRALEDVQAVWQEGICVYESESAHLCK